MEARAQPELHERLQRFWSRSLADVDEILTTRTQLANEATEPAKIWVAILDPAVLDLP